MSPPALAATFVYVSNSDDGNIAIYSMRPDGTLKAGDKVDAANAVMPMAVSPDKRFLIAAVRSKPYEAYTYSIDKKSGALKLIGKGPLAESYPYITIDATGRYLLGASYGANQVGVNPIGQDGKVGEPQQVIPTARNAHSIITDRTNAYVFAPHLGTDQIFQFVFDKGSGKLTANTPPVVQMKQGTGPRHIIVSKDNKYAYLLNELTATVTTFALDAKTGTLQEIDSASALPADTKLGPGQPRGPVAAGQTPRDTSNDIWASDLHLTPNGKFLYAAERTSNSLGAFKVDAATGKLTYVASTPTEKQPRGFAIDPSGKFAVVSGEKSDTISTYAIDSETGALKEIGKYPTGKGANWVEIVSFD
ncbi:MAG TPA: beta-propeller fold lactonase family protein [Xanthobacteraceae bacterium]|jgi:6-phosphogluconolactonase|nr:beta-propeller fold lactonase family protein [Xanthobacteraceae bacterium]